MALLQVELVAVECRVSAARSRRRERLSTRIPTKPITVSSAAKPATITPIGCRPVPTKIPAMRPRAAVIAETGKRASCAIRRADQALTPAARPLLSGDVGRTATTRDPGVRRNSPTFRTISASSACPSFWLPGLKAPMCSTPNGSSAWTPCEIAPMTSRAPPEASMPKWLTSFQARESTGRGR